MKVLLIACLAACFCATFLCAGEKVQVHRGQEHTFIQNPEIEALNHKITSLFRSKNWPEAEKASLELIKLSPNDDAGYYNLACAQARQAKKDDALRSLSKSADLGFDQLQHLKDDNDLKPLHEEKIWAEIVQKVSQNQDKKAANDKAVEKRMKIRNTFYGNQTAKALACCDAFLKEFPNDTEALLFRAGCNAKTKNTKEAFEDLGKYLDSAKRPFDIEQLKKNDILPAAFMKTPAYRAFLAKAEKKLPELGK